MISILMLIAFVLGHYLGRDWERTEQKSRELSRRIEELEVELTIQEMEKQFDGKEPE